MQGNSFMLIPCFVQPQKEVLLQKKVLIPFNNWGLVQEKSWRPSNWLLFCKNSFGFKIGGGSEWELFIIRSWNSVFCTHEKNILTLIFHGPHLDNGIYTKAKKVSLLREREVYPILFRGNEETGSFSLWLWWCQKYSLTKKETEGIKFNHTKKTYSKEGSNNT